MHMKVNLQMQTDVGELHQSLTYDLDNEPASVEIDGRLSQS